MKRFRQLVSFLLLFVLNIQVFGNTVVDPNAHQNTNVTHSQNGVEVININTPTDRGVSVNTFQEYNVDQNGQVINNATGVGRSHLGGLVNPNTNLTPGQEARTVIFQVNGSNRSNIEGYIEALSPHGINLFIANENGIYANGAGFINIDRAVLTTGRLNLRGDGSVDTISVRNGVITIGPAGFDASGTNYMAMISRTQELHGKIVGAGELTSITGTNDVTMNDIETQLVNAVTVSGAKPELAIDGSAFGAMYAGQIKIMATELGVGVKSDAVIYAENGGIEILANGDVVVNKLQGNNINIVGTNYEQTGVAYTEGNMNISALTSKILGEGTQVIGNITFTGSLDNRADIQTNGVLSVGGNLNNIANISSIGNMDIFGNIVNATGNIMTEGTLLSRGNVTNDSGKIVVEGSFTAQGDLQNNSGMIYSEKDINVRNISNNGVIQSLENLQAGNITNNNKIVSLGNLTGGNIINTSTIQSVGAIKVLDVDNSGTLLSESNIETHNLINRDTFISNGTLTTLNLTNETGALLQSVSNISTNSLVNRGDIATNGSMLSNNGFENYGTIGTQGTLVATGTNISNTGTIESGSITLTGANISNTGSLVGIENIILNTGYLQNTNSLLTNGNIEVTGNVLNQGTMEAGNDLRTRSLDNQGNITVTNNTIVQGNFLNTGRLLSAETLDIRGINFVNNNEVLATNVLIDVSSNIINTGELTGGNTASLKGLVVNNSGNITGHNVILTTANLINTNDILSTNNISLNHATINNTGNIRSNALIDFNNTTLTNNGVLESHEIKLQSGTLGNTGDIRSNVILNLNGSNITNSGTLESHEIFLNNSIVNNINTIRSNALLDMNNTWLSNSGTLESHEIKMINLSNYTNTGIIKGNNTTLQVGYDLNLTGLLHGENSLEITGHNITLTSGTTGVGYIGVTGHNITNDQTELAANGIILTASGTLTNNKMITGLNGILSGADIVNNDLIAFEQSLEMNATNNVINNTGSAIYSSGILKITASDTILNDRGNILGQGEIKLTATNKITNNVGQINTTGDILITSNVFENIGEVTGLENYELLWRDWQGNEYTDAHINATWKFITNNYKNDLDEAVDRWGPLNNWLNITKNNSGIDSYLLEYYRPEMDFMINHMDEKKANSNSAEFGGAGGPLQQIAKSTGETEQAVLSAGGNITINSGTVVNQDSRISGGGTVTLNADLIKNTSSTGNAISLKKGTEAIHVGKESSGDEYNISYTRNIVSGGTGYVTGKGSVIEGRVVVLDTNKLELSSIKEANGERVERSDVSVSVTAEETKTGTSQGLTGATGATGVTSSSVGDGNVLISRNTTPIQNVINSGTISPNVSSMGLNAMFAASSNPSSNYLMETRSQYIDISAFYGSDYFLSRIGFDEGKDWGKAKRLGDAYYEHLLLTRTIEENIGTRFINGKSDQELIKAMLDNSVSVSEDLNLSVGVKLTKEQIAALKEDIIWYAYEVVNGEQVLVPQVYLSQATLSTIEVDGRNKIGGQEGTFITADEIRNTGQKIGNGGTTQIIAGTIVNETKTNELAEIKGNKTIVVATTGNVENIGGKISGIESVLVVAEKGDVINSASTIKSNYNLEEYNRTESERLSSIGEISSEGMTYISGVNYISEAGVLGGKTVVIEVEQNALIGSKELKGSDKFGSDSKNYNSYDSTEYVGSIVSADNLFISGKNLNIEGSMVAVKENANFDVNNINIESKVNITDTDNRTSSKSFLKSSETIKTEHIEENVASQLIVGGSTKTNADINIIGSVFSTGDDSYLGGNVTATSRELNNSTYEFTKKKGIKTNFNAGMSGITAGVGIQKTEDTLTTNTTMQVKSGVSLGHGTVVDGDKFNLTATDFTHGAITINSSEVTYGATKNVYEQDYKHKESYIGVSASISSPLLNRIDQAYNGIKTTTSGGNAANLVNGGVSVLNSAVGTVSGLAGNQKGANNNFYFSATGGLNFSKSESSTHSRQEEAVVTTIMGLDENSSITYNNTNKIIYEGTQSFGDTFIYNNVKEIEKKGVELNNSYTSSSKNTGMNVGWSLDTVTLNPSGMSVSLSGGKSNTNQNGTSYQNGSFLDVNETYNNVEKMTISGFNQEGGKVTGHINELVIESLQATSKTTGSSSNFSGGTNMSIIGTASGQKSIDYSGNNSWSIGGSKTNGSMNYVEKESTFVIGEGSNLSIDNVSNTGAVIGAINGGKIQIDKYEGKDILNKDNLDIKGATVGGSFGKDGLTADGGLGIEYQKKEKEGITHNTVIGGVEIGSSVGDTINTDLSKVNETTKDKDTGHINTFIENDVLKLGTAKGREEFKQDLKLAGTEIDAMGKVIQATINFANQDNRETLLAGDNSDASNQKVGFWDVLQTERFQEAIRNTGYVDLSGKTDEEIATEIEGRYKDVFDRFGKEIDIAFYTNDEVSSDDPTGENKKNSQGFVGTDGKIWLNKDNITQYENFNLNNVLGHESVHIIKGSNTELLAQFGEQRSAQFISEAIESGTLSQYANNVIGWDISRLTESQRQDLASQQDIEEKLKFTNYNDTNSQTALNNSIKSEFYGIDVSTAYTDFGSASKKDMTDDTTTILKNDLTAAITNIENATTETQKTTLINTFKTQYNLSDDEYDRMMSAGTTMDLKIGEFKKIEMTGANPKFNTLSEVDKILTSGLSNNDKKNQLEKLTGVSITLTDLNNTTNLKNKITNNIKLDKLIGNEIDGLANDARWESNIFKGFYADTQKLTNAQLVVDSNDFVWYIQNTGRNNTLTNLAEGNVQYVTDAHMNWNENQNASVQSTDSTGNSTVNSVNKYDGLSTAGNSVWTGKDYGTGTGLIKEIIDSNKIVSVTHGGSGSGFKVNCTTACSANVLNGTGQDVTVFFVPGQGNSAILKKDGVNSLDGLPIIDGTFDRPSYIGYGHELIHAWDGINGKWSSDNYYAKGYDKTTGNIVYSGQQTVKSMSIDRNPDGSIIDDPNYYVIKMRNEIANRADVSGTIIENDVRDNLNVNINITKDSSGNITRISANTIIPMKIARHEYETVGTPYINRVNSSNNFIYKFPTNHTRPGLNEYNKPYKENDIRIEHTLEERGGY